ncbi:DUF3375 family protein [Brevibacterium litoralis]|uniref:DUF3375 family protein n=1 Tax=Brevibacterium litoralis TaxID=3138935 RepID=UPI0032EE95AF
MAEAAEPLERLLSRETANPTLDLLSAHSRDWVIPLFARALEPYGEVSEEEFHEAIYTVIGDDPENFSGRTPAAHCRKWLGDHWLESVVHEDRTYYRLSSHSLKALGFLRELAAGETAVGGARVGSIEHAVTDLEAMADPASEVRIARIDAQIAALQAERERVAAGRTKDADPTRMRAQLREIQIMLRALPADFRALQAAVAESHKDAARRVWQEEPPKADMLEDYLEKNEAFSHTREGAAYDGFVAFLTPDRARALNASIDHILDQDFAHDHMSASEREELRDLVSVLNHSRHEVDRERMRWREFLRRVVTRSSVSRNKHIDQLVQRAVAAGTTWMAEDPGHRTVPSDLLGVGPLDLVDVSQTTLWEDPGPAKVAVTVSARRTGLSEEDRNVLRGAHGMGHAAVSATLRDLLVHRAGASGADVLEATDPEFRRLGTAISLIDLATEHGEVTGDDPQVVQLRDETGTERAWAIPTMTFDAPIPEEDEE